MSLPEWISKRISALTRTATSGTLTDGEFMAVDDENAYTRKMTVAAFAEWVIGKWQAFVNGSTAATESDLVSGSKLPIMTANGPKSLPGNTIAKASEQTALTTYAQNVAHSIAPEFDPTRTSENPYKAGETVTYTDGKTYTFKVDHYGAWAAADVNEYVVSKESLRVEHNTIHDGWASNLSDLNDAPANSVLMVSAKTDNTTTTNFPADFGNGTGVLITIKAFFPSGYIVRQILEKKGTTQTWTREYSFLNASQTGTWGNWTSIASILPQQRQLYNDWSYNLASLDDAPRNSVIIIQKTANTTTTNIPDSFGNSIGILSTIYAEFGNDRYQVFQTLTRFSDNMTWRRTYTYLNGAGSWGSWSSIACIISQQKQIYQDWTAGNLASLDNAPRNSLVVVQRSAGTATTNFPSDFGNSIGILSTVYAEFRTNYQVFQTLTRYSDGMTWNRTYTYLSSSGTGSWSAWSSVSNLVPQRKQIYASWSGNLANLDNAPLNSVIVVQKSAATTTTNIPDDFGNSIGRLSTIYTEFGTSGYQIFQELVRYSDESTWRRTYTYVNSSGTGSWSTWSRNDGHDAIEIGEGKQYTTLRAGFAAAYGKRNIKVIVYPGVYDLVEECSDVLADMLTARYTPCPLGNGIHVIFRDGAYVKCNVEKGEMSDAQFDSIKLLFEPFAFKVYNHNGDFVIENLNIEAKNCRYCVHDDTGATTDPYVHKFVNCHMYKTNSNITPGNNTVPCIGGGLGKNGTIVIDGGYYQTEPVVGWSQIEDGDLDYQQQPISYHNGDVDDAESSITLKDVYFADKGYFAAFNYGPSDTLSKIYISGCRFGLPWMIKNMTSEQTEVNMAVKAAWDNEIAVNGSWQIDEDGVTATFVPAT